MRKLRRVGPCGRSKETKHGTISAKSNEQTALKSGQEPGVRCFHLLVCHARQERDSAMSMSPEAFSKDPFTVFWDRFEITRCLRDQKFVFHISSTS